MLIDQRRSDASDLDDALRNVSAAFRNSAITCRAIAMHFGWDRRHMRHEALKDNPCSFHATTTVPKGMKGLPEIEVVSGNLS